jgi:hypothetical protein
MKSFILFPQDPSFITGHKSISNLNSFVLDQLISETNTVLNITAFFKPVFCRFEKPINVVKKY